MVEAGASDARNVAGRAAAKTPARSSAENCTEKIRSVTRFAAWLAGSAPSRRRGIEVVGQFSHILHAYPGCGAAFAHSPPRVLGEARPGGSKPDDEPRSEARPKQSRSRAKPTKNELNSC
jgi:hypothetical protein